MQSMQAGHDARLFLKQEENMKHIELKSYAKINLSLDVCGLLDNGYHEVEMIMQQILLCDDISVKWRPDASGVSSDDNSGIRISLSTNRHYLPNDQRNLAYRAAMLMAERFGAGRSGSIRIDIKKRIPVAAGLAGGSSNCAAVIHALNLLWDLELPLDRLCELGAVLGSDVPFCMMGQAAADITLSKIFQDDPLACHCALAYGTGTDLRPLKGLRSHLVISKPPISVSTAEVYRGIDEAGVPVHPDNELLIKAVANNDYRTLKKNMINVLENFTLKRYPIIVYTKNKMRKLCKTGCVLMSGSGPTVFGLCRSIGESKAICREMLSINKETMWTRTTW